MQNILVQPRRLKDLGAKALKRNDLHAAVDLYSEAGVVSSNTTGLLSQPGVPPVVMTDGKDIRVSLLELELACRLNCALCYTKMKRWEEAMDAANWAVQLGKMSFASGKLQVDVNESAKAYFRRGMVCVGLRRNTEALEDLETAAQLAPQDKAIRRELDAAKSRMVEVSAEPLAAVTPLRFAVGDAVQCKCNCGQGSQWEPGTVVQQNYRESEWPKGQTSAYQVELNNGTYIHTPEDGDHCIKRCDGELKREVVARASGEPSAGTAVSVPFMSGSTEAQPTLAERAELPSPDATNPASTWSRVCKFTSHLRLLVISAVACDV